MMVIVYTVFIIFMLLLFLVGVYFLIAIQMKKHNEEIVNKKMHKIIKLFYYIDQGRAEDHSQDLENLKECFGSKNGFKAFHLAYQSYIVDRKTTKEFKEIVNGIVDYEKIYKNRNIKESYRKSYVLYLISEFDVNMKESNDLALKSLMHSSLYVRISALNVIRNQKDVRIVMQALKIIDTENLYFNKRVVIDFLDGFRGSQEDLDQQLILNIDQFDSSLNFLILDHLVNNKNSTEEVKDKMFDYLENSKEREAKIKSTRYFNKVKDNRAKPLILENMNSEDWGVRAVSVQSVESYADKNIVSELKKTIGDSNYFVRKNSAQTLLHILGKEELFEEALNNEDDFARDVLNYVIESSNLDVFFENYKTNKELEHEKEKLELLLEEGGM